MEGRIIAARAGTLVQSSPRGTRTSRRMCARRHWFEGACSGPSGSRLLPPIARGDPSEVVCPIGGAYRALRPDRGLLETRHLHLNDARRHRPRALYFGSHGRCWSPRLTEARSSCVRYAECTL